jgi:hypothetical protein
MVDEDLSRLLVSLPRKMLPVAVAHKLEPLAAAAARGHLAGAFEFTDFSGIRFHRTDTQQYL